MPVTLAQTLIEYGALPGQLVDLSQQSARALRYADLWYGDKQWSPPVVAEHELVPRLFVFDARTGQGEVEQSITDQWCRRILLRGDPAWTAILRPGRLDVLSFDIRGSQIVPRQESLTPGNGGFARFVQDVRSGASDLPRRLYLKNLLSESMQQAVGLGLSQIDAVSLVGWGLFWRFLVDRDLLVGKNPEEIAQGAETWTDCLNTKGRALKTLSWLDETFNGGLLPFEQPPREFPPLVFSRVLGNIAAGATAQGQLRLPTDWDEIDFSHVPVGLLSEVYEAFATQLDQQHAKSNSIHYTPRHIAEFVVSEAIDSISGVKYPKILDPAVGAGVFLIAAFRKLVQAEWERTGSRPKRKQIRRILSTQLYAFDTDKRALRLAQLGLYLTALELDPSPTPIEDLKFVGIDKVLRERLEEDGSLGKVDDSDFGRFDLVVGNPPWTSQDRAAKARWVSATRKSTRDRIGIDSQDFDLPDANPDIAFLWRSGEWAKEGGQIALVVHARWLFGLSERMFRSRKQIFDAFQVTGILNCSALRRTSVWPNVSAPFCLVFARNQKPPANSLLQFVSPFVETEEAADQVVLRVDWSDSLPAPVADVVSIPWALKSRFRGDGLARRALNELNRVGVPLRLYLQSLDQGLSFRNGYQVGGTVGKKVSAEHLLGLPDFSETSWGQFVIDSNRLPKFGRKLCLRPRSVEIYLAPLLIVRDTVPADPLQPRSFRASSPVVFNESFHGISFAGIENGDDHAKLLQVFFQSRVALFASLLTDAKYGVERETIYQDGLEVIPVIPLEKLRTRQLKQMRELCEGLENGINPSLFQTLNQYVYDLFELDDIERQAIEDTLDTRGPSSASVSRAVRPPSGKERDAFLRELKAGLDDVLHASRRQSSVTEIPSKDLSWRVISVSASDSIVSPFSMSRFLKEADEGGASIVIVPTSHSHVYVGIPDRYRHWTRTQALLLANELLAGALGNV